MTWACTLALAVLVLAPSARAMAAATPFADLLLERWTDEDGLPQISVLTLSQDRAGYLWVGTQNGIARFDGRRFVNFGRSDTGLDLSMPTSSLAGADGEVWFGTPRGLLRQQQAVFSEVAIAPSPTAVRALTHWRGELLAATADGLRSPESIERPRYLAGESLHAVALHADGALWAGGDSGVFRLDPERNDAGAIEHFPLPVPQQRVLALAVWNGQLAMGTRGGVWLLDPQQRSYRRIFEELADVAVPTLQADRYGSLWASSVETLQRLHADGVVESIVSDTFVDRPWVNVVFEDAEGDLWLGSQRESLLRLSQTPTRVLSRGQGLDDPLLWSVLEDAEGLLVGSNSGLSQWRPDAGFRRIDADAALPDPAIYSLHRDRAGQVWLGTRSGLARLAEGRIESREEFQPLANAQITSFADADDAVWVGSLEGLWRWQDGRLIRQGAAEGAPDARIRSLLREPDGSLLVGTEVGVRRLREGRWEVPEWAASLEGGFVSSFLPLGPDLLLITTLDRGIALLRGDRLQRFDTADGLPSSNAWAADRLGDWVYLSTNDGAYRLPLARLLQPQSSEALAAEITIQANMRARGDQRMGCCNGGGHARSARIGASLFYPTTNGLIELDTGQIRAAARPPRLSIESAASADGEQPFPRLLTLAGEHRDLSLQFAAVDLRQTAGMQFRYRLQGYQTGWVLAANQRAVYTRLPPGRFQFQLQGRHPGGEWIDAAQSPQIVVPPLWFERRLVQAFGVVLLAALVLAGWRYSLARAALRRQALERAVRERTEALARANERLRSANTALLQESRTDALTGIGNRRAALQHLVECPAYALLLVDLDHFKALNDLHGHAAGDQVLGRASALLRGGLPPSVHLARWGGEEFLAIWPALDLGSALQEAERIRAALADSAIEVAGGSRLRVSCSIGVAVHPALPGSRDWQLTMELADRALYRAKADGRDCVRGAQLRLDPGEPLPQEDALAEVLDRLDSRGRLLFLQPHR